MRAHLYTHAYLFYRGSYSPSDILPLCETQVEELPQKISVEDSTMWIAKVAHVALYASDQNIQQTIYTRCTSPKNYQQSTIHMFVLP